MTRAQLQARSNRIDQQNGSRAETPDRRVRIAEALNTCIQEQGYAATSLTHIASKAGLTPSHLRYYFASKDDILDYFFERYCDQIMAEIVRIRRTTPEEWLEKFSAYIIGTPRVNRASMGAMVEIFGVALHHQRLAAAKERYDSFLRRVFLDFFLWAGTARGVDPSDAAYTGWSLEIGMKLNSLFQRDFSHEKAGAVFLSEMRRMAGLDAPKKARRRRKSA